MHLCTSIEKNPASFSLRGGTISNGIFIRGNTPLSNEPITMVTQLTRNITLSSFNNSALPRIEIPFQIVLPPDGNGAELFSINVH